MSAASNSKSGPRPAPTNFLDALRELERDFKDEAKIQITRVVTNDLPEAVGFSPIKSGTLSPNESLSLPQTRQEQKPVSQDKNYDSAFFVRLRQIQEEDVRYRQKETGQIREQIKSIQEEVRLLAKSAGQLSQEIEVATFQATVNPGIYHKHFLSHLKSLIQNLRKKVSSSHTWLSEHNNRASKRGYYWAQVQKSGTKYMMSQERYMVTSTG